MYAWRQKSSQLKWVYAGSLKQTYFKSLFNIKTVYPHPSFALPKFTSTKNKNLKTTLPLWVVHNCFYIIQEVFKYPTNQQHQSTDKKKGDWIFLFFSFTILANRCKFMIFELQYCLIVVSVLCFDLSAYCLILCFCRKYGTHPVYSLYKWLKGFSTSPLRYYIVSEEKRKSDYEIIKFIVFLSFCLSIFILMQ